MPDQAGDKLPQFQFSVQFGDDKNAGFMEVDGLDADTKPIEYRHGNSPSFYPIKMPGLGKVGNVILRKGIVAKDAKLWDWLAQIKSNVMSRRIVIITLHDAAGAPKMTWRLREAWPIKITGPDLKSEGNEVAVESIEIAYEDLEVKAP